jgi:EAL domain-containing protein (putative c-di-GMP-specific phosphodiesterase class I)
LKIDRSFVSGVPHHADDNTIVTAIINLAHNLGLKIVAEGVETEDQKNFLKNLRCETIQGYLISKPGMPDEVVRFLKPRPEIARSVRT